MPINVAIVEDDQHYNNALKKIINFDEDLVCVAQFFDGEEAIAALPNTDADVVLMDIKLPSKIGIDIVSELSTEMENTQFIMCTSFEYDEMVFKALKAGATGYLLKGESMEKIISSVKEVYNGGAPMSFSVAKKVLGFFRGENSKNVLSQLTATEQEVLNLLSEGLLYKEIADRKNVSIDTVKKHIGHIYRKLHVNNKVEAINILKGNH